MGAALLAAEKDLSVDLRQYATLAAPVGLVLQGERAAARELIDRQLPALGREREGLPWLLTLRGSTFQGSPSPARAASQPSTGGKS